MAIRSPNSGTQILGVTSVLSCSVAISPTCVTGGLWSLYLLLRSWNLLRCLKRKANDLVIKTGFCFVGNGRTNLEKLLNVKQEWQLAL